MDFSRYQQAMVVDGRNACRQASTNDRGRDAREWARKELIPWMRSHGGYVPLAKAVEFYAASFGAGLKKVATSFGSLRCSMQKTLWVYSDMEGQRFLAVFDAELPDGLWKETVCK